MSVLYVFAVVLQGVLGLILLPILGTLVSSGISENLRFPWFVISPSACKNTTLSQFRNNSLILNPEGWNLYPEFAFCPAAGLTSQYFANSVKPTSRRVRQRLLAAYSSGATSSGAGDPHYTYSYSGCIHFDDPIWTTMDTQNKKAGYQTFIANGANHVGGFFRPLMVAAVVFFWLFGMVGVVVSIFVHVHIGVALALFGYSFAWALWLSAYVLLITTDLIVSNSYVNSFFNTCTVSVQWGHGAVLHLVVLFIGGTVLLSPFALYAVYMFAQPLPGSFLHPGFKDPPLDPHTGRINHRATLGDEEEGKGEGEASPCTPAVALVEKPRTLAHFHTTLVGGDHKGALTRLIARIRGLNPPNTVPPTYAPVASPSSLPPTTPKATTGTAGSSSSSGLANTLAHAPMPTTTTPTPTSHHHNDSTNHPSSSTPLSSAPKRGPTSSSTAAPPSFNTTNNSSSTTRLPGEVEHEDVFEGDRSFQGGTSPNTRGVLRQAANVGNNNNNIQQPSSAILLPPPPPSSSSLSAAASMTNFAPVGLVDNNNDKNNNNNNKNNTINDTHDTQHTIPNDDDDVNAMDFDESMYDEELAELTLEEQEILATLATASTTSESNKATGGASANPTPNSGVNRRLMEIRAMKKAIELERAEALREQQAMHKSSLSISAMSPTVSVVKGHGEKGQERQGKNDVVTMTLDVGDDHVDGNVDKHAEEEEDDNEVQEFRLSP